MLEATLKDWQDLCKQAVVEQDPIQLLKLFLQIDRLQNHAAPTRWQELPVSQALPQIPCPYCSALLEPQEQIIEHNVFKCPWCEGQFGGSGFSRKETEDAAGKLSRHRQPQTS